MILPPREIGNLKLIVLVNKVEEHLQLEQFEMLCKCLDNIPQMLNILWQEFASTFLSLIATAKVYLVEIEDQGQMWTSSW